MQIQVFDGEKDKWKKWFSSVEFICSEKHDLIFSSKTQECWKTEKEKQQNKVTQEVNSIEGKLEAGEENTLPWS